MALLSETDRQEIFAKFMEDTSRRWGTFGNFVKADLRNTVDAVDVWIENNIASFNSALPEPCKSEMPMKQKLELFLSVIRRKWEVN
jgi:hypothetical protein